MKEMYDTGKELGLQVHTDGARIFNASTALGVDVKEIAKHTDTVQFCLSKGLAAPVGSMVVGSQEVIDHAKSYRRMLGGSMRQAGIIAHRDRREDGSREAYFSRRVSQTAPGQPRDRLPDLPDHLRNDWLAHRLISPSANLAASPISGAIMDSCIEVGMKGSQTWLRCVGP